MEHVYLIMDGRARHDVDEAEILDVALTLEDARSAVRWARRWVGAHDPSARVVIVEADVIGPSEYANLKVVVE
jgi:hypothetical protein